jgi:hypothetical protein
MRFSTHMVFDNNIYPGSNDTKSKKKQIEDQFFIIRGFSKDMLEDNTDKAIH